MASLKFRCLTPNVTVEEHLVKADEKFFHEGSHFVILNGSGLARVCINNEASIYGWAHFKTFTFYPGGENEQIHRI